MPRQEPARARRTGSALPRRVPGDSRPGAPVAGHEGALRPL